MSIAHAVRRPVLWLAIVAMLCLVVAGSLLLCCAPPPALPLQPAASAPAAQAVAQGRYLALAGNCAGCHTARGGEPYAGGRGIPTPFGTVYAGNLTPHETGLKGWTAEHFWHALHHGRGADGRALVPAFPYTEYTRIQRADSDALFAFLQTLTPINQPNRAHELRWPYGTQAALAAWRWLYFKPGVHEPDASQSPQWNRGAYLVQGLGHCAACHASRNALGGKQSSWGGSEMPAQHWQAPALNRADQAGVATWSQEEVAAFLRTGRSAKGHANGPMAEVVMSSTQHLLPADLAAVAAYLRSLPPEPAAQAARFEPSPQQAEQGSALYADHCANCHGKQGEGGRTASGTLAAPALAGNRLVTQSPAANLVKLMAQGGFGAATWAEPLPFGMPPFEHVLSDAQLAAVATYLRSSWGHQAAPVQVHEVARWRGAAMP